LICTWVAEALMGDLVIRYLDIIKKYLNLVKEKSNYEIVGRNFFLFFYIIWINIQI